MQHRPYKERKRESESESGPRHREEEEASACAAWGTLGGVIVILLRILVHGKELS